MRYEEFVKEQIRKLETSAIVEDKKIPDMELYMDQAAGIFGNAFAELDGNIADRFAAKPMINNYTKKDLIPRPEGKRYSRDHMIMIAMVVYLRGMFKIEEIRAIMKPLVDNYNSRYDDSISFELLYTTAAEAGRASIAGVKEDVDSTISLIKKSFEDSDLENDQQMEVFTLISALTMRADMEKYLVKRLMETYFAEPAKEKKEKKDKPKKVKSSSFEGMSEL